MGARTLTKVAEPPPARPAAPRAGPPAAVVALFALTGASGLMLEVVWSRMLGWLLGATTWSVMAVLVAFLGGLGLGALLWGRRVGRSKRPLRLFGWLEIGIGLYSLAVPLLFEALGYGFVAGARLVGDDPGAALALRVVAAVLALAPPTLLMGGTLPVLTRFASAGKGQPGRTAGTLYAANTAGAVVGCAATGCFLIPWLGVVETNVLAAVIDLSVGLLAWRWGRRAVQKPEPEPSGIESSTGPPTGGAALAIATASGFFGLAYEVLWTRSLVAVVTDDTTYAFTLMLTAFLAGHALGAAAAGRSAGSSADWRRLGTAQVLAACAALLSIPFLVAIRDPVSKLSFTEGMTFWGARVPFHLGVGLAVLGPSAFFLGASFALAARLYVGRGRPVGASTGRLYGLNTLGAIAGAIAVTAWLIPALGTQRTLVLLASLQAGQGVLAMLRDRRRRPGLGFAAAAWAAVVLLLAGLNALLTLSRVYARQEPGKLLALVEGRGAAVTVHQRIGGDRVISINGVNVAGTNPALRVTQKIQAHLPACLHRNPERVLQIGFGSGGTCHSVSLHAQVRSIEVVELNPDVLKVAHAWFRDINRGVLDDPRVRVRIADARSHVAATDATYDLILSDSTHPRFRGNAALYGRDYFANCARRLRPGGLLSTWLPLYGLSVEDMRGILASLQSVFPHVQVWYANIEPHENTLLVASLEPIELNPGALAARLAAPAVAADLAVVGVTSATRMLDFFVLGDRAAASLARGARLNTDDHPSLEFQAPRSLKRKRSWVENFAALRAAREPIDPYLAGAGGDERATLRRWWDATTWKLAGQAAELDGQADRAIASYERCVAINPADYHARARLERLKQAVAMMPAASRP